MSEWLEDHMTEDGYRMFFRIGMTGFLVVVCLALISEALS